jgi:hypothetical protein
VISRRQTFWINSLKNLAAIAGLVGFCDFLIMYSIGTSHWDSASGHIFRHSVVFSRHDSFWFDVFYLTAQEDFWYFWISAPCIALLLGSVFAIRMIGSYDPGSANLAPRSPDQDPLANRRT